jgi:phosphopantothenoylcysteine decarboxylase/phosphopantothenate--cysteine ligase
MNKELNMAMQHRHIVIGVTGGIAAYKTCELVRRIQDEGATVQVVMTEAATRFVSAMTFQALTGRPVYTNAWEVPQGSGPDNGMAHIDLSREADAILVAPASADFLARLASGQSNDLLTTLCMARDIALMVAPAMNRQMWQQPSTQRNVQQLIADGVQILQPGAGPQACGEIGDGRMQEPHELLAALKTFFSHEAAPLPAAGTPNIRGVLQGKHAVITAGPTYEPIDPVRGITNRSSGKMGFALAAALKDAGATVHLISGPVQLPTPLGVHRQDVITAQDMHQAVHQALAACPTDLFIGVAAVADWRPQVTAQSKMKKDLGGSLAQINWVENPDILASVAALPTPPFCVGFAAETGTMAQMQDLLPAKRARKAIPLLVGNIGPDTFGSDHNQIMLCHANGTTALTTLTTLTADPATKTDLARHLVFAIAKEMAQA